MNEDLRIPMSLLLDVIEASESAYRKLQREYHQGLDVVYVHEGWAEAERLRDALDALRDDMLARGYGAVR